MLSEGLPDQRPLPQLLRVPISVPSSVFQMVLDEGQGGGGSFQGDLNRAGKVKVRADLMLFFPWQKP